jgi:hypothetical protein
MPVKIESVLCPQRWTRSARVLPGCWITECGTQRGDVALLELDAPVTCHPGARLQQAPVQDVLVRVCGFPDGDRSGIWAEGRLAGAAYDGERVQIHDRGQDRGQWITQGYSGAGVAASASGRVVGIVVTVRHAGGSTNAWMMPVETIVDYLPAVRSFVDGVPTSDLPDVGGPQAPPPGDVADIALRQEIGRLFDGVWSGAAVITGGSAGAPTPALARVVATSDPAARRRIPDTAITGLPRSAVLAVGAIDLAIDATGRTVAEIQDRVAERFGFRADGLVDGLLHRQPPPALVIDRLESAADPAGLVSELVAPLAAEARRYGLRLVTGFAGPLPANLAYDLSLGPEPFTGLARGAADRRVTRRLLTDLALAEQELAPLYVWVSARVDGLSARPRAAAPRLRVRFAAATASDPPDAELALIRDRAEAALAETGRLARQARDRQREYEELGHELSAYRQVAEQRFGAEDLRLSMLYDAAHRALHAGPCDLAMARAAVGRYVRAVHEQPADPEDGAHDGL